MVESSERLPSDPSRALQTFRAEIGSVALGAMTFGDQVDSQTAESMVQLARDAGVKLFDTSNNYSGGASEEILGQIVHSFRDEVLISTKVGSAVDQNDASTVGLSRKAIVTAVEGSLRRLRTDYIDIYNFHRPDWQTPLEESLAAVDELVSAGKVRFLGQSNFAAWQLAQLDCLSRTQSQPALAVSQVMYNLLARRVEDEYAAYSGDVDMFDIAYNPLAGGLLTGKHGGEQDPEPGTRFSKDRYRQRYWNQAQFSAVDHLRQVADDAGLSLIELALRWVRDRDLTDAILIGASVLPQLAANLQALGGPPLDEETTRRCDDVWTEVGGAAPRYNR